MKKLCGMLFFKSGENYNIILESNWAICLKWAFLLSIFLSWQVRWYKYTPKVQVIIKSYPHPLSFSKCHGLDKSIPTVCTWKIHESCSLHQESSEFPFHGEYFNLNASTHSVAKSYHNNNDDENIYVCVYIYIYTLREREKIAGRVQEGVLFWKMWPCKKMIKEFFY